MPRRTAIGSTFNNTSFPRCTAIRTAQRPFLDEELDVNSTTHNTEMPSFLGTAGQPTPPVLSVFDHKLDLLDRSKAPRLPKPTNAERKKIIHDNSWPVRLKDLGNHVRGYQCGHLSHISATSTIGYSTTRKWVRTWPRKANCWILLCKQFWPRKNNTVQLEKLGE